MDEEKFGVRHFRINPQGFRIYSICFDILHLRSAQTRNILDFCYSFIREQICYLQQHLSGLSTKAWGVGGVGAGV